MRAPPGRLRFIWLILVTCSLLAYPVTGEEEQEISERIIRESVRQLISATSDRETLAGLRGLSSVGEEGLPAWLELLGHDSWRVREAAVRGLGRLNANQVFKSLMKAGQDPSWIVRRQAIVSLGRLGDDASLDLLRIGLTDTIWAVRAAAIDAVRLVAKEAASDLITPLLDDPDPDVRFRALRSLFLLRLSFPHPAFFAALEKGDETARRLALTALCEHPVGRVRSLVEKACTDPDPAFALFAFENLLTTNAYDSKKQSGLLQQTIRAYGSHRSRSSVQDQASRVLTMIGAPAAAQIQNHLMKVEAPDQNRESLDPERLLRKLTELRQGDVISIFEKLIAQPLQPDSVRSSVYRMLGALPGDMGLRQLLSALQREKSPSLRRAIAKNLRDRKTLLADEQLGELLADRDAKIQLLGLSALLRPETVGLLSRLPKILLPEEGRPIAGSLEAERFSSKISRLAGIEALPIVLTWLDHPSAQLRENSLLAVSGFVKEDDRDVIVDRLLDRFLKEDSIAVRQRIVLTLALSDSKKVTPVLEAKAKDQNEDETVRRFCIRKLASRSVSALVRVTSALEMKSDRSTSRLLIECLLGLSQVRDPAGSPVILGILSRRDRPENIRLAALKALHHKDQGPAREILYRIAENPEETGAIRVAALETLTTFPALPADVDRILNIIDWANAKEVTGAALLLLGKSREEKIRDYLANLFRDKSEEWLRPPSSAPNLVEPDPILFARLLQVMAQRPEPELRSMAFELLFEPAIRFPDVRLANNERFFWMNGLIQSLNAIPPDELLALERKTLDALAARGELARVSEENLADLSNRFSQARLTYCSEPLLLLILETPPVRSRRDLRAARRLATLSLSRNDYPSGSKYFGLAASIQRTEDYDDPDEDGFNHRHPHRHDEALSLLAASESHEDLERCFTIARNDRRACLFFAEHLVENGITGELVKKAAAYAAKWDPTLKETLTTVAYLHLANDDEQSALKALWTQSFLRTPGETIHAESLLLHCWLELRRGQEARARTLLMAASCRSGKTPGEFLQSFPDLSIQAKRDLDRIIR